MPQDVKLFTDGRLFYVADMMAGGRLGDQRRARTRIVGFVRTGAGAHGLYPSRDARLLYVSNRSAGTVSVISFHTNRVVHTWTIPRGSPDMGGVSANGKVLWLSGPLRPTRSTRSTRAMATCSRAFPSATGATPDIRVQPQPGRHSLGHTGILSDPRAFMPRSRASPYGRSRAWPTPQPARWLRPRRRTRPQARAGAARGRRATTRRSGRMRPRLLCGIASAVLTLAWCRDRRPRESRPSAAIAPGNWSELSPSLSDGARYPRRSSGRGLRRRRVRCRLDQQFGRRALRPSQRTWSRSADMPGP